MEYGGHADAEEHIETCYGHVYRELQESESEILSVLMQCAEELPHKSPLYGTLVGLINTEDSNFASKIVQQTHDRIQGALDSGECNKLRVLIRFLTVLMSSNVVAPASLVEVFEALLSSAATTVDDEKGNPAWQPRADFYVFCILASLPWAGLDLSERASEELERVMAGVEAYLSIRKSVSDAAFNAFNSIAGEADASDGEDYLEDLWRRIKDCRENGWKVESVPRPHLVFESRLVLCQSHEFGSITCPDPPELPSECTEAAIGKQRHEAEHRFPKRLRRIQIFPPSKTDGQMTLIDRFVVEEYLLDVLFHLNGCRKECAAYMAGLPLPFRYEYLMAETVFSQLLLLRQPPFKPIYYTIVIIDLCKALPGAFPTVVAGAVRALFNRIGDLDVECRTRLVLWFAHHLSNFQFVWPWEEWAHIIELPKWAPQRYFVQEVLEKEVRLAYLEKIKQSLEAVPKLVDLLPAKNSPCFKYGAENQDNCTESEMLLSTELTAMVKGKKSAREIQIWVEEKILPSLGQKAAIEIIVQTMFYLGSKSFTHMTTVLERYGQVFAKLASDQGLQVFLIQEVSRIWQNNAQMTVISIDRMMGYRIISNLSIASWVFATENVQQFHTSDWIWEVLRNAINKTINRTADLRKEVTAAEKGLLLASGAASKAFSNLQAAQALLNSAETEEAQTQATAKAEWAKSMVEKRRDDENSAQETVEAKNALLTRALKEQEALFITVCKSFSEVLTDRLSKDLHKVGNDILDKETASEMDIDGTNEEPDNNEIPRRTSENSKNGNDNLEEQEEKQWRRSTLGQFCAIIRQYAREVWEHIERLDADVFSGNVHPLILKTVNSCIRRA